MMSILSDNKGKEQDEDKMLKKELFMTENIHQLIDLLDIKQEANTVNYYDLNTISLQLCYSSVRAFNMACSNVFSNEVLKAIEPYIGQIKSYLFAQNVHLNSKIDPFGLDTELIKLLRNFTLIPESNLLIERNYHMDSEDNEVFDADETATEDIEMFLKRAKLYAKQLHLRAEGQKFVMEGVLPYIYKYSSVLLNLTNFEIKQKGFNPYSTNH
jgi:hypothetical protein